MTPCYGCEGDLLVRMLYPPTQKKTASGVVEIDSWVAGPLVCDGCAGCMTLEGKAAPDDLSYLQCISYDTDLRDNAMRVEGKFIPPQQPLSWISYRFQELRNQKTQLVR